MVGMRFIVHSGIISDVEWLRSVGFDEVGLVIPNMDTIPSPMFIHKVGVETATLGCLSEGIFGVGAAGGSFAGHFQAIKTSGWDMISGGDISGDVVRTIMNNVNYCNYGKFGHDVYSPPYIHPVTGPNTYHVDYIDTTTSTRWYMSCIELQWIAITVGNCAEVGIRIGLGNWEILESSVWVGLINYARSMGVPCNNVCFYGDVDTDGTAVLKDKAYEVLKGLSNYYGIRHGIGGV